MFTGEEIGVMKAVDEANATIMANGYGDAPRSESNARATGAISTAVAVLEMNNPRSVVIENHIAITMRGPAQQCDHGVGGQLDAAGALESDRERDHTNDQDQVRRHGVSRSPSGLARS